MAENQEQALDLSFFMPGKAEVVEEVKAPISTRFKDKAGNLIPFVFKPISTERVDEIEKMSMRNIVRKNRVVGKEVDQSRFMARIAVETTVYPNFKAEELRKAYKTEDPVEVAKKVLHVAGEYSEWISKVSDVNGFDQSVEDLEETAKNL
ncbi:phage portal protein [Virgibacillus sp. Bac330]|uniref:phage tail assembly chaperone n=1 Tax=Virgibacillus sp. Bac330 TaxID=2419841 RepID=UPI00352A14AC